MTGLKNNVDRCDCCGRFASGLHSELYTLYGIGHENEEDVAICLKCSDEFEKDPVKGINWLNEKFGESENHDVTRT